MALHCAVFSCSNGSYRLMKWKEKFCDLHGCRRETKECSCEPPFRLFTFPSAKKNPSRRKEWQLLINREDKKRKGKLWSPKKDSRVCSLHFVDGLPTGSNPNPTLNLGYEKTQSDEKHKRRRLNYCPTSVPPPKPLPTKEDAKLTNSSTVDDMLGEQEGKRVADLVQAQDNKGDNVLSIMLSVALNLMSLLCSLVMPTINQVLPKREKRRVIKYRSSKRRLYASKRTVQHVRLIPKVSFCQTALRNDRSCKFYTGINSVSLFNSLHELVSPYTKKYWRTDKQMRSPLKRSGPNRKIDSKDAFLLMLMKLRLGLLEEDLSDRFNISISTCSRTITTWLRAASMVLDSLVFIPNFENVKATTPNRFRKIPNLHSILDCTEIFIETPKDHKLQAMTWSQYKHHNTLKFLVCVSPNSSIIFKSKVFTGRASDKDVTVKSGYLDYLPPYSTIMYDKGFLIQSECLARRINTYMPPGKRGASQMTTAQVLKTKKIANLRILVEQVIRRIKSFKILSGELNVTWIRQIDDIVTVCCALSNLQQPIYKN